MLIGSRSLIPKASCNIFLFLPATRPTARWSFTLALKKVPARRSPLSCKCPEAFINDGHPCASRYQLHHSGNHRFLISPAGVLHPQRCSTHLPDPHPPPRRNHPPPLLGLCRPRRLYPPHLCPRWGFAEIPPPHIPTPQRPPAYLTRSGSGGRRYCCGYRLQRAQPRESKRAHHYRRPSGASTERPLVLVARVAPQHNQGLARVGRPCAFEHGGVLPTQCRCRSGGQLSIFPGV